ncbi:uncharacterized protein LOC105693728 [Athalia rosae]|uniref:uncharacterized protein LOC105693728 n=1 Tax=Athalia rosae TaxID=37344 RepID=UPI0020332E2E|nr:uncharacterized protein LOC105693728 [Athalia rosae]XP_048514776.1 uncharacterized protein LOC105693728 [Athalia rosae]XP_048514777.1 uncharacterized protein LOC105693728 [Athalia rosae]
MMAAKRKLTEIPVDAVVISPEEALKYQTDLIREWPNLGEVSALRFGVVILSGIAAASGSYLNTHFRRKLKLGKIGFASTYLPIVALPAMAAAGIHKLKISHKVLLEDFDCPLCLQAQAAIAQVFCGFVYPTVLGALGTFMYATRAATYRLPDVFHGLQGPVQVVTRLCKPIRTQLTILLIGQALSAAWITDREIKSYCHVKAYMAKVEEEYDREYDQGDSEERFLSFKD